MGDRSISRVTLPAAISAQDVISPDFELVPPEAIVAAAHIAGDQVQYQGGSWHRACGR